MTRSVWHIIPPLDGAVSIAIAARSEHRLFPNQHFGATSATTFTTRRCEICSGAVMTIDALPFGREGSQLLRPTSAFAPPAAKRVILCADHEEMIGPRAVGDPSSRARAARPRVELALSRRKHDESAPIGAGCRPAQWPSFVTAPRAPAGRPPADRPA
jgi:hypothetical protein